MVDTLQRMGWPSQVIAGNITRQDHQNNGNNSVIHPLTILHFTNGAAPHYTVQAGWIQSLFLFTLGRCDDQKLNSLTQAMLSADRKGEIKAAMQAAFGRGVGLDNLNFYLAGGNVATFAVTLQTAFETISRALRKVHTDKVGRVIVQKDLNWLATSNVAYQTLAQYRLKEGQQGTWQTLSELAARVSAGIFAI